MKLFGQKPSGPNVSTLVIPREKYDIVIVAQAVLDDEPFKVLCPRPTAPKVMKPGGTWQDDTTDKDYLKNINNWATQKTNWMMIESLKATPKETLEWERVDYNSPSTWGEWQKELEEAYFTAYEIAKIVNLIYEANGLNQDVLDQARNRFLAGQVRLYSIPPSPTDAPETTQSGELVKDSESAPTA